MLVGPCLLHTLLIERFLVVSITVTLLIASILVIVKVPRIAIVALPRPLWSEIPNCIQLNTRILQS